MSIVVFAEEHSSENSCDNVKVVQDCEERDAEEEAERPPEVCNLWFLTVK